MQQIANCAIIVIDPAAVFYGLAGMTVLIVVMMALQIARR